VGVPLIAFIAVTLFWSWLFQYFYLRHVVLESETLKLLTQSIFEMAVLGSFAVTIRAILCRHRAIPGRSVPVLTKTTLVALIVLSSFGFVASLTFACMALWRMANA
jgi:hypothetical protein